MTLPDPGNIDPAKFDLVMRDADFVIYYDHHPLTTQGGVEIAHPDSRMLKHILIQLTLDRRIDFQAINSLSILSFCKDYVEQDADSLNGRLFKVIEDDPILTARFDPEVSNRFFDLERVIGYLEENNHIVNLILLGASVMIKGIRDLFSGMDNFKAIETDFAGHREEIVQFILDTYGNLPAEKKAAINILSSGHKSGILLPMMLVLSIISPSEYSLSAITVHTNYFDEASAERNSPLSNKDYLKPLIVDWNKPDEGLGVFHNDALKVMEFLVYFENPAKKMSVISALIDQGEHDKLEFKSTFRWDMRQDKKNPAIEHAALKSISAFLNSDGGDLLIGVADDGSLIGIERDNFLNDDKFLLHVWTLIKTSLGKDISPYLKTTLEKFGDKTVCRVHCMRSPKPVFLRQTGYEVLFYIRIGPSSGSLDISEAFKYINDHFNQGPFGS